MRDVRTKFRRNVKFRLAQKDVMTPHNGVNYAVPRRGLCQLDPRIIQAKGV
jgi:hypothetical protein